MWLRRPTFSTFLYFSFKRPTNDYTFVQNLHILTWKNVFRNFFSDLRELNSQRICKCVRYDCENTAMCLSHEDSINKSLEYRIDCAWKVIKISHEYWILSKVEEKQAQLQALEGNRKSFSSHLHPKKRVSELFFYSFSLSVSLSCNVRSKNPYKRHLNTQSSWVYLQLQLFIWHFLYIRINISLSKSHLR